MILSVNFWKSCGRCSKKEENKVDYSLSSGRFSNPFLDCISVYMQKFPVYFWRFYEKSRTQGARKE